MLLLVHALQTVYTIKTIESYQNLYQFNKQEKNDRTTTNYKPL